MTTAIIIATVVVVLLLIALLAVYIKNAVQFIPSGEKHIVERLGKYHKTMGPGIKFIVPIIDRVVHKVTTRDIVVDIPPQNVITKDNANIIVDAIAYINIISPERAIYEIDDYRKAIETQIQTTLRGIIGEMDLDDALSSRDKIKSRLKASMAAELSDWGIELVTMDLEKIHPSESLQRAMDEQAAAERHSRATIALAEGKKKATILEAEGRLEASRRDAQAKVVMAEAEQTVIQKLSDVAVESEIPVLYLLGQRYIEAMKHMAESDNAKTIVLPADLPASIRGIIGSLKK